jgi:hypothetical protein
MDSLKVANDAANQEVLATLASELVWIAICGYIVYRVDGYIRRRGYQSPFRAMLTFGAYIVALGFGFYSEYSAPGACWKCTPAANPDYFRPELVWPHVRAALTHFWASTTLGVAVIAAAAVGIPRRARRFGARPVVFPWRLVSRFWLILTSLSTLAFVVRKVSASTGWRLGILCFGLYKACDYLASRARTKGMTEALREDPRAPVLYLRVFEAEEEAFATLSFDECQELGVLMRNPTAWRHPATLEEYFTREINRCVGPLVALGDPYDYLPPMGASREYFHDVDWQAEFQAVARRCRFILMRPEFSENLLLELQSLRTGGLLDKLCVVSRPAPKLKCLPRWWSLHRDQRRWQKFAVALCTVGLDVGQDPGLGAVVSFDRLGRAVRLAADAQTPGQYVAAIEMWRAENDSSDSLGRHSPPVTSTPAEQ